MKRRSFLRGTLGVAAGATILPGLGACFSDPVRAAPEQDPIDVREPGPAEPAAARGASPEVNRIAFQRAVDRGIAERRPVIVPADDYLLSGDIRVHGRLRIIIERGAVIRLQDHARFEHGTPNNQSTTHAAAIFWLTAAASGTEFECRGVLDANGDRQGNDPAGLPFAPNCIFVHGATQIRIFGDWEARRAASGVFAIDADDSLIANVRGEIGSTRWNRGAVIGLEGCRNTIVRGIRVTGYNEALDLNNSNEGVIVENLVAWGTVEGIDINGSGSCTFRDIELRNCVRPLYEAGATTPRHTRRALVGGSHSYERLRIVLDHAYPHTESPGVALFHTSLPVRSADIQIQVRGILPRFAPPAFAQITMDGGTAAVAVESDLAPRGDAIRAVLRGGAVLQLTARTPIHAGQAICRIGEPSAEFTLESPVLEQPPGAAEEERTGLNLQGSRGARVDSCSWIAGVQTRVVPGVGSRLGVTCTGESA